MPSRRRRWRHSSPASTSGSLTSSPSSATPPREYKPCFAQECKEASKDRVTWGIRRYLASRHGESRGYLFILVRKHLLLGLFICSCVSCPISLLFDDHAEHHPHALIKRIRQVIHLACLPVHQLSPVLSLCQACQRSTRTTSSLNCFHVIQ